MKLMCRKFTVISVTCILMTMAGGCASEAPYENPATAEPAVKKSSVNMRFNIMLNPDAETRTPRELTSSASLHCISDMRIYLFRSESGEAGTFTYTKPLIRNNDTGVDETHDYFHVSAFSDADEPINYACYIVHPKLADGYYRFLAVGSDRLSKDAEGNLIEDREDNFIINWREGETKWEEALIENKENSSRVNEIFSGYNGSADSDVPSTYRVRNGQTIMADITLKRAVGGVIFSAVNVPAAYKSEFDFSDDGQRIISKGESYPVTEVGVISEQYSRRLLLTGSSISDHTQATPFPYSYGSLAGFSLSAESDVLADGYYANRKDGSPFINGNFLFPARLKLSSAGEETDADSADNSVASLYLCLFTEVGGRRVPIKRLPIRLVRSEEKMPGRYSEEDSSVEMDGRSYNLLGNNIYCLGTRENPLDLKGVLEHPELEIIVLGAWQADIDIEL